MLLHQPLRLDVKVGAGWVGQHDLSCNRKVQQTVSARQALPRPPDAWHQPDAFCGYKRAAACTGSKALC
jgi:hypothetical protein